MKRSILAAALLLSAFAAFPQQNTSADLSEKQVYRILESAEIRGLIPQIRMEKPYPRSFILECLKKIEGSPLLEGREASVADHVLEEYRSMDGFSFSAPVESDTSIGFCDPGHPNSINGLGLRLESDIFPSLTLDVTFSMLLNRTNEDAFLPYKSIKNWDHHNMDTETRLDDSYESLAFSNRSREELAFATEDGTAFVRLGRFLRDWGPGEHSLLLSDTARPFLALESGFPVTELGYVSSVAGSLGITASGETNEEQKMFSAHKLTVYPLPWMSFSFWESVVYGKRLELAYLSPVSIYLVSQMATAGDRDNSTMGFDLEVNPISWFKVYGSLFIDEIEHDKLDRLFAYPKNMFAYYCGIETAVPGQPFATARFQYSKLEPFVYTHYKESRYYFAYDQPVNINYTNDGTCLGFPIPPNSDEFTLAFSFLPLPGMAVDFEIGYIRHGDNPGADGYVIRGDIEEPLSYGNMNRYPDKNFLNDGIYENIISFEGRIDYSFKDLPISLYAGYGFALAKNSGNIQGNNNFRNVFSFGGSYKQKIM